MNIPYLLFGTSGGWEWIIILLVILLLFGAKRLPELAKGLGKGIREFKGAIKDVEEELDSAVESVENDNSKTKSSGD
ncbi:MAG: twin-arginine translocase TatA/TatE family subunit [Bacteroidetes bacterium]|nr:twin-arginine translocase TatA/TatE family subunit [Bacteroidota bacterium]MCH8069799.1 twin-arginine translocase TatA/TatE family subunit [Candidatus Neomarinimicrobiota bacterium]